MTEGPPVHRLRSRAGTGGREGGSAEPLCHCCHPPAGSYSLSSSSSPSSSLSQVCCWCSAPLPVFRSRDFGPVTPRQRQVTRTSNLPWLCAPSHVCALGSGCRWGRCGGGVSPRPALAWARGSAPLGSSGSGSLQPWGEPWLPAPSSQEEEEEDGMVCERPFQLLNSSSGAAGPRRGSGLGARLFMGLTDRTQLAAVVTHTPQRWPKPYTPPPPLPFSSGQRCRRGTGDGAGYEPRAAPGAQPTPGIGDVHPRRHPWVPGGLGDVSQRQQCARCSASCPFPSRQAHGAVPSPRQRRGQTDGHSWAGRRGTNGCSVAPKHPLAQPQGGPRGAQPTVWGGCERLGVKPLPTEGLFGHTEGTRCASPPLPLCHGLGVALAAAEGPGGSTRGHGRTDGRMDRQTASCCPPQRSAVGGQTGSGAGSRGTKVRSAAHGAAGDASPRPRPHPRGASRARRWGGGARATSVCWPRDPPPLPPLSSLRWEP